MSCLNCYDNCINGIVTDKCVQFTGDTSITLGITQGDSLYTLLGIIIENLEDRALEPTYSATCEILQAIFGRDVLIGQEEMINGLAEAICQLRASIDGLVPAPISFDTECLTLGDNPTRDDVLQAAITKLCAISTSVTTINNDYVKASDLCTLVTQCISNTASTQEYTKMPKYVALPYHGPTSVFDANGKGLSSAGYDKIYMCLGQTVNGFTLPDYRGRSPIGVNTGIPLSGIDSSVNPALPANAGYAVSNKQKIGKYNHTLTITEEAPHTHTVTDPGHKHTTSAWPNKANVGGGGGTATRNNIAEDTSLAYTGITIGSSGGGQPHNNTHPSVGAIMMMYCP